jgi:hypothetical protein
MVRFHPHPQELPNFIKIRTRSSTVERFVYIEDVGGSNPSESTKCLKRPANGGNVGGSKCYIIGIVNINEPVPGTSTTPREVVAGLQRVVPADIFDASVRSQRGELVDITSLIPVNEEEGKHSFQNGVQESFDWIAKTVASPEYAQFAQEIGTTLESVRDQDFLFDIEGTLMNDVQNLRNMSERVYYVNPWMRAIVGALIKNGNRVGFWTSATAESLAKMRKAMSPEMAILPTIGREDYERVVIAYRARHLNQLTDQQVLEIMQSVYPTANMETFQAGIHIFTKDTLEAFNDDSEYFLRGSKFPQLFISPDNGFFVDDNDQFIDSATRNGLPKNRAVKCDYNPGQENAIKVAQTITSAIKR